MPISNGKYYKEDDPIYLANVSAALNAPVTGQPYVPSTVTGESLTPTVSKDYNPNANFFSTFPPAPEAKPDTLGTTEKSVSDMIKDLMATSGLEAEKTAYQLEQEKAGGLEEFKTKEADYTAQYKQLESEYKNLQIESQKVPYQVEGEFTGRAGVYQQDVMSRARQREITLKSLDVSARANTVSGLLLATQGLLTAAEKRVEKAVNDKYAVREAERKTKLDNLELLSKDPNLSLEQSQRVTNQKNALKKEEEETATKKENSSQIMKWAVEVAGNPSAPKGLADKISDIGMSKNPDMSSAFELYSPYAKEKEEISTATREINGRIILYNSKTGETIKDMGAATATGTEEKTELTKRAIDKVNTYFANWKEEQKKRDPNWDGYVDPADYINIKTEWASVIGDVDDFDKIFSSMLAPQERGRLGVGVAAGVKALRSLLDWENIGG